MRLWHKDLIQVLPRQQLLGQWRECCLIVKNIAEKGTPGHLLVNRIMEYPPNHFYTYFRMVFQEMIDRGYKCSGKIYSKYSCMFDNFSDCYWESVDAQDLFSDWHTNRYLVQCYYNLEEKYDCGGISEEEWVRINGGLR